MTGGERIQALMLLSGGLDSLLAACVLLDQGVDLTPVVFTGPWCVPERAHAAADLLDLPLREIDFTPSLVRVFERAGAMDDPVANLALEVHAQMLRDALGELVAADCQFVATGDILDQCPATQGTEAMQWIAEAVDGSDRVVRPLSARLLPPSTPERLGWLVRDALGTLQGPDCPEREAMAAGFGIDRPPVPSARHRLDDPAFALRLQDLRAHEGLRGAGRRALRLLTLGRHFRLGPVTKLVVGRDELENQELQRTAELYDLVFQVEDIPGPTGLLPIIATDDQIRTAASICARFSEVADDGVAPVRVRSPRESRHLEVEPIPREQLALLQV
jgi:hypothetical protein